MDIFFHKGKYVCVPLRLLLGEGTFFTMQIVTGLIVLHIKLAL